MELSSKKYLFKTGEHDRRCPDNVSMKPIAKKNHLFDKPRNSSNQLAFI